MSKQKDTSGLTWCLYMKIGASGFINRAKSWPTQYHLITQPIVPQIVMYVYGWRLAKRTQEWNTEFIKSTDNKEQKTPTPLNEAGVFADLVLRRDTRGPLIAYEDVHTLLP